MSRINSPVVKIRDLNLHPIPCKATFNVAKSHQHKGVVVMVTDKGKIICNRIESHREYPPTGMDSVLICLHKVGVVSDQDFKRHMREVMASHRAVVRDRRFARMEELIKQRAETPPPPAPTPKPPKPPTNAEILSRAYRFVQERIKEHGSLSATVTGPRLNGKMGIVTPGTIRPTPITAKAGYVMEYYTFFPDDPTIEPKLIQSSGFLSRADIPDIDHWWGRKMRERQQKWDDKKRRAAHPPVAAVMFKRGEERFDFEISRPGQLIAILAHDPSLTLTAILKFENPAPEWLGKEIGIIRTSLGYVRPTPDEVVAKAVETLDKFHEEHPGQRRIKTAFVVYYNGDKSRLMDLDQFRKFMAKADMSLLDDGCGATSDCVQHMHGYGRVFVTFTG